MRQVTANLAGTTASETNVFAHLRSRLCHGSLTLSNLDEAARPRMITNVLPAMENRDDVHFALGGPISRFGSNTEQRPTLVKTLLYRSKSNRKTMR